MSDVQITCLHDVCLYLVICICTHPRCPTAPNDKYKHPIRLTKSSLSRVLWTCFAAARQMTEMAHKQLMWARETQHNNHAETTRLSRLSTYCASC